MINSVGMSVSGKILWRTTLLIFVRRTAFVFLASRGCQTHVSTTHSQSITGLYSSTTGGTGLDQRQYTAPRGSPLFGTSHQDEANRFLRIADARPDCWMFTARLISKIDRGTPLVPSSDMRPHIRRWYLGSSLRHHRSKSRHPPCDAYSAYEAKDSPCSRNVSSLCKHCLVFNDL